MNKSRAYIWYNDIIIKYMQNTSLDTHEGRIQNTHIHSSSSAECCIFIPVKDEPCNEVINDDCWKWKIFIHYSSATIYEAATCMQCTLVQYQRGSTVLLQPRIWNNWNDIFSDVFSWLHRVSDVTRPENMVCTSMEWPSREFARLYKSQYWCKHVLGWMFQIIRASGEKFNNDRPSTREQICQATHTPLYQRMPGEYKQKDESQRLYLVLRTILYCVTSCGSKHNRTVAAAQIYTRYARNALFILCDRVSCWHGCGWLISTVYV